MDAVKYFEIKKRMTMVGESDKCAVLCKDCPLSFHKNGRGVGCLKFERRYPEEAVAIVEKWDKEHIEITAEEFAERMKEICTSKKGDPEALHGDADELMISVLKGLGYSKGIEILEDQDIWYA